MRSAAASSTSPSAEPATLASALRDATRRIAASGSQTARLDAELVLAAALGCDRGVLHRDPGHVLAPAQALKFQASVARRVAHEPIAYILGRKGFRSLELHVDPRVLVPRPETEALVESGLGLESGTRVVDVGTGSGAVALALKHERPDLRVSATDSSIDALVVARANAERLGLDVRFFQADLLDGFDEPIDAVLSNPPYVAERDAATLPPDVLDYEPSVALFGGPDGLDVVRRLVRQAASASLLAVEVGAGQADAVARLLGDAGFDTLEVVRDLARIERVVIGRRC